MPQPLRTFETHRHFIDYLSEQVNAGTFAPAIVYARQDDNGHTVLVGTFAEDRQVLSRRLRTLPRDTPLIIYHIKRDATVFKTTDADSDAFAATLRGDAYTFHPGHGMSFENIHAIVNAWYENDAYYIVDCSRRQPIVTRGERNVCHEMGDADYTKHYPNAVCIAERDGQFFRFEPLKFTYYPGYRLEGPLPGGKNTHPW